MDSSRHWALPAAERLVHSNMRDRRLSWTGLNWATPIEAVTAIVMPSCSTRSASIPRRRRSAKRIASPAIILRIRMANPRDHSGLDQPPGAFTGPAALAAWALASACMSQ